MDLIVDSGATKADWIALDNCKIAFSTQTLGLNPHVLTSSILRERIINNFEIFKNRKNFKNIYFYGAGCGVKTSIDRMYKVFDDIFENCKFILSIDSTYGFIPLIPAKCTKVKNTTAKIKLKIGPAATIKNLLYTDCLSKQFSINLLLVVSPNSEDSSIFTYPPSGIRPMLYSVPSLLNFFLNIVCPKPILKLMTLTLNSLAM